MKTVLTFVQDETGSMLKRTQTTIEAFNEYFATLKDQLNSNEIEEVDVVVWQFSSWPGEEKVRLCHDGSLGDVPVLDETSYRPRGNTPLLDAVGTAVQQQAGKEADRFLFIVQTDGLENDSKDFTREQVAELMAAKEKLENWTVVFLGVGINNWTAETAGYGVTAGSTMSSRPSGQAVAASYASMGQTTSDLLRSSDLSDKEMGVKAEKLAEEKEKGAGKP